MFSQKSPTSKTVLSITDTDISYVTLKKNSHGFFIHSYERVPLVTGAVVNGEILMVDFLYKIIKKITITLENKNVDILLPHEHFLCTDTELEPDIFNTPLKKRITQYFKTSKTPHSWQKTHVCEFSYYTFAKREKVLFTCLPKDIHGSYIHVLEKAGLRISAISSNILAFDHILPIDRTSLIYVTPIGMYVAEFKNQVFSSYKNFQASSHQFVADIAKHLMIKKEEAQKILDQYGVLRSHKDERVYKRILRSLSPLLDFMSKRKIKDRSFVKVIFADKPIPGLVDIFKKRVHSDVAALDIFRTDNYSFQDILSLHRKDSYYYQAHIAQALKAWQEK